MYLHINANPTYIHLDVVVFFAFTLTEFYIFVCLGLTVDSYDSVCCCIFGYFNIQPFRLWVINFYLSFTLIHVSKISIDFRLFDVWAASPPRQMKITKKKTTFFFLLCIACATVKSCDHHTAKHVIGRCIPHIHIIWLPLSASHVLWRLFSV